MALTELRIRAAKPADKPYKLADGGGLFLYVTPTSKLWRMRYVREGKEQLLSFGPYPGVSLAAARDQRDAARALLRFGKDPGLERKLQRAAGTVRAERTFEAVARAWWAQNERSWTPVHAADVLTSLEQGVFPKLGGLPLDQITPPMVLAVLREIEARPAIETARRVRQRMSAVFVYAIASGIGEQDPAAIVRGALAPLVAGRQPAITELPAVIEMLATAEAIPAHPATKLGLRLLALTAVRPGVLCGARWSEFEGLDGDVPLWRIPAGRMKMRREHLVPLSCQALEVVKVARALSPRGELLFPNARHAHKPMSENAIGYLLNRAGYHNRHVPHGWRATFSTIMNERYPADRHTIDLMLAHSPKDKVEAAYNRATRLARRRELAQMWADLLLDGRPSAEELMNGPRR